MDATVQLNKRARIGLFAIVLVFGWAATSCAQPANDGVEKLRQVLNSVDRLADRDRETKACLAELHTLSELRKAAVLREWRHRNANAELAAIDQANRDALAERFCKRTRQVLSGSNMGTILAALEMLNETAASMQAIGEPPTLTRPLTADVARLVGETDPAVRAAAARTLGRIDPDPAIALPLLIGQAKSPDETRRLDAATALGEMLLAIAQPWTGKEFNPTIRSLRRPTVENAAKVLPLAGACVLDPNREVRRRSLTTLALAATLLERLLPPVRVESCNLSEMRPLAVALHEQLKPVTHCLHDHAVDVKMAALKVLEQTGLARRCWLEQVSATALPGDKPDDPLATGLAATLPALAETLTDDDVTVRRATLDVLEVYGPLAGAAAPATALALRDSDPFVRWSAVRTLGAIGPAARPAIPALTKLLQDPDLDVRQVTAAVIHALDPTGQEQPDGAARSPLPALIRALSHDSVEMRLSALHNLAAMGGNAKPALTAVALAVRDPDAHVRLAAVQALGAIGPAAKTVAETLRLALKDEDAEVRKAAGEALLTLEREP